MAVSFEGDDVRQGVPENLENLVAPHIDSFDYFVERGLPEAVRLIRPVEVHDSFRKLRFYLWWENPSITKPFSEDGQHRPVYPSEHRQARTTYHPFPHFPPFPPFPLFTRPSPTSCHATPVPPGWHHLSGRLSHRSPFHHPPHPSSPPFCHLPLLETPQKKTFFPPSPTPLLRPFLPSSPSSLPHQCRQAGTTYRSDFRINGCLFPSSFPLPLYHTCSKTPSHPSFSVSPLPCSHTSAARLAPPIGATFAWMSLCSRPLPLSLMLSYLFKNTLTPLLPPLLPAVLPHQCRQAGTTYRGDFRIDLCVSYFDEDDDVALADVAKGPMQRQQLSLGRVPIMVKSGSCHLRHLTQEQLVRRKEESIELGGYFICNDIDRLNRLLIAPPVIHGVHAHTPLALSIPAPYASYPPSPCAIPMPHRISHANSYFICNGIERLIRLLIAPRRNYVSPLLCCCDCLMDVSDAELYEHLTAILTAEQAAADPPETDKQLTATEGGAAGAATKSSPVTAAAAAAAAAGLGTQFVRERALVVLSHPRSLGLFTRMECLAFLGKTFRPAVNVPSYKSDAYVGQQIITDLVLVHLDKPMDKLRLLV
ncbi:unnamed protein product [Closterium sp. Yama58-4]|nr:unnamed protein product [Closterium sp. Yama58-4]